MIHIVCALPCEAEPIIKKYKLKKNLAKTAFPIYENERITLIISGIGKIKAACAVNYLHCRRKEPANEAWINIGLGGHMDLEIGCIRIARKVNEAGSKLPYYPGLVFDLPCPSAEILTVDLPERVYSGGAIFEMEASGFYSQAIKYSTVELIHCLKVVSDNLLNPIELTRKDLARELIEQNLEKLETLIFEMENLRKFLPLPEIGIEKDV